MKNFLLVIIVFLFLISCEKKGDPKYKGNIIIPSQKTII